MNTAISISTSNRVAAGVTAAYLRDLSRRPASPAADDRGRPIRRRRPARQRAICPRAVK